MTIRLSLTNFTHFEVTSTDRPPAMCCYALDHVCIFPCSLDLIAKHMRFRSSFLTNAILTGHADEPSTVYNKPFLVTWLCTSSFSLYLIRPACEAIIRQWRPKTAQKDSSHTSYSAIPVVEGEPAVNTSDKLDTRQVSNGARVDMLVTDAVDRRPI